MFINVAFPRVTYILSKIHKKLNAGLAGVRQLYVRVLSSPQLHFYEDEKFLYWSEGLTSGKLRSHIKLE